MVDSRVLYPACVGSNPTPATKQNKTNTTMATPTSNDRYVEAQLSIAKGALKRAQEAITNIDGFSN